MHYARSALILLSAAAVALIASVDGQTLESLTADDINQVCKKTSKDLLTMAQDQIKEKTKEIAGQALNSRAAQYLMQAVINPQNAPKIAKKTGHEHHDHAPMQVTVRAKNADFKFIFTLSCDKMGTEQATGEIVDCQYLNAAGTKIPVAMTETRKITLTTNTNTNVDYCAKCVKDKVPEIATKAESPGGRCVVM